MTSGRSTSDACAPFFAGYVARVPDGDIVAILRAQLDRTRALLAPLSREQVLFRPTPENWNILEVLGHITDGEQIFAYRAPQRRRPRSTLVSRATSPASARSCAQMRDGFSSMVRRSPAAPRSRTS
ncbi:MAG: DinB family protein, partial [Chloroflexales bacterium]|nr:DinB family protein [Chloroflexales bacterium]